MPWEAATLLSLRLDFCIQAETAGCNFSDLCRKFGISREIGYKWLRRYRENGITALQDRSRQPHSSPGRSSPSLEQAVIDLRLKYPAWGPRKLRALLKDHTAEPLPSISTVCRILKRHGMIESKEPEPVYPVVGRFERGSPNELWQMDLKAAVRLPNGHKIYPVGLLDDHSRYLLGLWMIPGCRESLVIDCWIKAAQLHGLPESTLTDHGVQFRNEDHVSSAFRVYLWACGVEHTQGRVKHPQTQGKIERLWGTLKRELLSRREYRDLLSWQSSFDDWREQYNNIRPHQELGDEPPASRYRKSDRPYIEPDRNYRSDYPGSKACQVHPKGEIFFNGRSITIGRGYAGWRVEVRPISAGCWHVYFRDRFVKELVFGSEN